VARVQRALRILLTAAALALAAGCGGGPSYSGPVKRPAGYATYRAAGVSFVYPARFGTTDTIKGLREVRFAAPGAPPTGAPFVLLGVQPGQRGRFQSILDQKLAVMKAAGATTDVKSVKVPGAVKAARITIRAEQPGGAELHNQALELELRDGTHLDLTAGGPKGQGAVDVDAVLGSVRVEGGR
jgi:hypothetical protein